MSKHLYLLLIALLTTLCYGQNITLQKNVNYQARALKQSLNKRGDSLILSSKKTIKYVVILNENFLKSIDVDSTQAKINLNTLPVGDFIVQAKLGRKWIVMTVEKSENGEGIESIITSLNDTTKGNWESSSTQKSNEIPGDSNTLFWVVYESNSGLGSSKSMSLEYKNDVSNLIAKHKLELKSEAGKNNKLLVYELYNKSKFMTKQIRNPKFYTSRKSKVFNVVPIYASGSKKKSEPKS